MLTELPLWNLREPSFEALQCSQSYPLTKPDGFSSVLILLLIKSEIWELEQQHLVYCINKLVFLPLFHPKVDPNIYKLDIIAARGWHWW